MTVATFKVRSDSDSTRPSKERVDEAARALVARGLKVVHQGRFGVTVEAPNQNLTEVTGVPLEGGTSIVAPVEGTDQRLTDLFESIEIKPKAQLY